MRVLTKQFITKWATLFASLALLIATSSVQTTCLFMSYQPDVPDELKCE
jgi:cyclic lactone autoinducer peptide